jgi:pimeloyl-ACP methyl ester carboxylesterase
VWGVHDRALSERNTVGLERWVPDLRIERIDASHWVMADAPDRLNELLVGFLRG